MDMDYLIFKDIIKNKTFNDILNYNNIRLSKCNRHDIIRFIKSCTNKEILLHFVNICSPIFLYSSIKTGNVYDNKLIIKKLLKYTSFDNLKFILENANKKLITNELFEDIYETLTDDELKYIIDSYDIDLYFEHPCLFMPIIYIFFYCSFELSNHIINTKNIPNDIIPIILHNIKDPNIIKLIINKYNLDQNDIKIIYD